jgi:hypothetical protein
MKLGQNPYIGEASPKHGSVVQIEIYRACHKGVEYYGFHHVSEFGSIYRFIETWLYLIILHKIWCSD